MVRQEMSGGGGGGGGGGGVANKGSFTYYVISQRGVSNKCLRLITGGGGGGGLKLQIY